MLYKMDDTEKLKHLADMNNKRVKKYYELNKDDINKKRREKYSAKNGIKEKGTLDELPILPYKGKKFKIIDEEGNALLDIRAITEKDNINIRTRKNYENILVKLQKLNDGRQLINTQNSHILKLVSLLSRGNPSSEFTILNIPIVVKKEYDMEITELDKRRIELEPLRKEHTNKILEYKSKILPSLSILQDFTKSLYTDDKFASYIVNYLLIKYGVRNKDLNVFITDDKKVIDLDKSINYLLYSPTSVKFIRNDYKTVNTYGVKMHNITDKKFNTAISNLSMNTWLFTTIDNKQVDEKSLSGYVTKHTYDGLNESDYFKINVRYALNSRSPKASIVYLCENRGVSAEVVLDHYTIGEKDTEEIEL